VWHVKKNPKSNPTKNPPVEYFTKKQADEEGIVYVPWRTAMESGQWVITDDQFVVRTTQVKYITEIYNKGRYRRVRRKVKTGLGIRFPHGRREFNLKECIEKRCYNIYPEYWWQKMDTRYPALKTAVAKMVLTGRLKLNEVRRYDSEDYKAMIELGERFIENKPFAKWYHVRTFIGNEEVRNMIRGEIARIAKDRGVTVDKVFDLMQEAEGFGRAKKDGKIILAVAREYAGIVGMNMRVGSNGGDRLPPHADDELPGAETTFERIIDQEQVVKPSEG